MAFTYTRDKSWWVCPGVRAAAGSYTNGASDTGGDVKTGLKGIRHFECSVNSHIDAANAKWTAVGGVVTIVTGTGVDGTWTATGY